MADKRNRPELLAPAGDMERLKMAVLYGADAVYLAGTSFGMRAFAGNFSPEELPQAVAFAHDHGVRVHCTINTMPRNDEVSRLPEHLERLNDAGVDALIVADLGAFSLAGKYAPRCQRHISTQASICNYETARAWHDLGASRVILARELSLEEIRTIRDKTPADLEIEVFVHGAMCVSYSGRCLLSNYLTGRDSSRGACAQPCRYQYALVEEKRPGEYFPVFEDQQGTYILNSRDMCMIDHVGDLIDVGLDSLKIEGRMKTALYVATVARTYRKALDDLAQGREVYEKNLPWYEQQITGCTYRRFTTGFFYGKPDDTAQIYDSNTYEKDYVYLGITGHADENGVFDLEQKNKFSVGEIIEIMKPDGRNIETVVEGIWDLEGNEQESAPHARQALKVKLRDIPDEMDLLRRSE